MILYRSDKVYGNAGHTPAEILAYETINLGNHYILSDLYDKCSEYLTGEIQRDAKWLMAALEKGIVKSDDENIDYSPYLDVFKGIVRGMERYYKKPIKYLLWLTDMDSLLDLYCDSITNCLEEVDAYMTGGELIHIEGDGNLYAYSEKPKSLSKYKVKEALDENEGLYKVYVPTGYGYTLATLYFNHMNVSIEEIGAYCAMNNIGHYMSEKEYEKEYGDAEDAPIFTYIDLSEYKLDNTMLFTELMKTDEKTKIN